MSAVSSSKGQVSKGTIYAKFQTALTGMLESFRSEGNMLVITKHLVDRDVSEERSKGWVPAQGACNMTVERRLPTKRRRMTMVVLAGRLRDRRASGDCEKTAKRPRPLAEHRHGTAEAR